MSNHFRWTKLFALSLGLVLVSAQAAEKEVASKGVAFSGAFEGGYNYSWRTTTGTVSDSNWLVDYLAFNTTANISDHTKVVFNNAMAINVPPAGGAPLNGSSTNFGGFQATSGLWRNALTAGRFVFANTAAYVSHKCSDSVTTSVGSFDTMWGMESAWKRFDMPTYYYSMGYAIGSAAFGFQDYGVKVAVADLGPGSLDVAITEGYTLAAAGVLGVGPQFNARYAMDVKSGDMSLTPTITAVVGRWSGGPKSLGFTAGTGFKMGGITANAEVFYTTIAASPTADPAVNTNTLAFYVEPGVDLGFLTLSTKLEWFSRTVGTAAAVSDINIGAAIGHTYAGGYRVRAAYQHAGFSGTTGLGGNHANDFRVEVGAKF